MTREIFEDRAEALPVLQVRDGRPMADSRDVAKAFGKEHKNVLQTIDNLLKVLMAENSAMGFIEVEEAHPTVRGRKDRYFLMDRDAYTLAVMSFTGAKALRWKLRYIEAFNTMDAILRAQTENPFQRAIPKTLAEALRLAAAEPSPHRRRA